MDKETRDWLRRVAERSGSRIEGSDVFVSVFTENYKKDPQAALELGIALVLGKPIYLVCPCGTSVPPTLARIADGVEFFDPAKPGELEAAAGRLVTAWKAGRS